MSTPGPVPWAAVRGSGPAARTAVGPPLLPLVRPRPAVLDAARTALIPMRPLTIGEILDGAFLVVRRNARLMVGLPLVIAGGTAAYVLLGVGLWVLLGNTTISGAQTVLTVLMALVGFFALVQCLVWMTAILSRVSLQTVLGPGFAPTTTKVNLRTSLPLFWPMLGLSVLQYLASSIIQTVVTLIYYAVVIGALVTNSDPNVAAGLSLVVSLITVVVLVTAYGYISLTVPAFALESRNAPGWIGKPLRPTTVISSFERSVKLVGRKNLGRVVLIFLGAWTVCLGMVVLLAIGALAVVLLFGTSINQDLQTLLTNPWTLFGVFAFAVVVAMSGLLAYLAAVQTLVYLDLRMRREALDMALRFDCVPIPQPTAPLPVMTYYPPPGYPAPRQPGRG